MIIAAKGVKIVQVNLGRGYEATKEAILNAENEGVSILLLQEPYTGNKGYVTSGYRIIQNPSADANRPVKAAAIVLDTNLVVTEDSRLHSSNITGFKITLSSMTLAFINIYLEGDISIDPYLDQISEIVRELNEPNVIIAGDVNAKSVWWGCREDDARGTEFMQLVAQLGMCILNEGTTPTFHTYRGNKLYTSIVDVTACSTHIQPRIRDWRVNTKSAILTDHRQIEFNLVLEETENYLPNQTTWKFNTRKADWSKFQNTLQKQIEEKELECKTRHLNNRQEDIEDLVTEYTTAISEACEQSLRKIKTKTKRENSKWWNEELKQTKQQLINLKRKIKQANHLRKPVLIKQLIETKAEYKSMINKAITDSWKNFCSTQEKETMWQKIYRVIRKSTKREGDKLMRCPNNPLKVLDPKRSASLLAETFYPLDDPEKDTTDQAETRLLNEHHQEIPEGTLTNEFTNEEIEAVLAKMNPRKAPGEDGFTSDICEAAYRTNPVLLKNIFNHCMMSGVFPQRWKKARIKIIPKPGRADYQIPKSYRPIGLLPVMGKILEKMIANRIIWKLGHEQLISARQYGFLPQRSTEDALYDAVELIKDGIARKKLVVVVSLDIEGAFDHAWWPAILHELKRKQLDPRLWNLIRDYLRDRSIGLGYAGAETNRKTTKGCIQGSTCGPIMWNVLLDPLLQEMERSAVHTQAFADDILLVATGETAREVESKMSHALDTIANWGCRSRLKFAANKTQAVLLTKKQKFDCPRLRMQNTEIEYTNTLKILGLTLDKNLNFLPHMEEVNKKAVNIFKSVSRTARAHWGLNPEILRTIYIAVIEPVILYGSNVWGEKAHRKQIKDRLDRTTRMFTNLISKAHRTTSLLSSCIISRILPLDLRALEQRNLYEIKRGKPVQELPGRQLEKRSSPFDLPHPAKRKRLKYDHINDEQDLSKLDQQSIHIFTDGSKLEGKVGGAITCWRNNKEQGKAKITLPGYCSVFQAEMAAIYKATTYITANKTYHKWCIISDSRSALQSLEDPDSLNPIANLIKSEMETIRERGGEVELYWVKAHINIEGNERADELAKEAALKSKTKHCYEDFPLSYAKRIIRNQTLNTWQERYEKATAGDITKLFFPSVHKAYKIMTKLNIDNNLSQLLTGHGGFRGYLFKRKLATTPNCSCDDESEETVPHIIIHCPKYALYRHDCETEIKTGITTSNIKEIIEDDSRRSIFIAYAKKVISIAGRANGAKTQTTKK